ncbi:MAG: helix-turn-helix domain-containing protein [Cyclobacteriaceae bacterium]
MPDQPHSTTDFLSQVTGVIEQNLANEQFGVTELADAMHMSRSNLLRKVKKETNLSVSQLISQVRLKRAMHLLRTTGMNVSEVSHEVGFNSTSYFIKCFREYYGYPPGETGNHPESEPLPEPAPRRTHWGQWVAIGVAGVLLVSALIYIVWVRDSSQALDKSIAVLPFKNESNDSTNVYLINGLMESTLLNLQKIKDLRVISRTSSEKYRHSSKSIPEMARELNVNYFVEGSGQKIGNQILLNIQLIEAASDRPLWSSHFKREVKDIFQLQQEIAKRIAEEIKAVITPDEEQRISKKPTANLVAYDLFLQGSNRQALGSPEDLEAAIGYFRQAIAEDPEFALAYAEIAICYYYLEIYQAEKKHLAELSANADKAFLYDSRLGESLVAKAVSYLSRKEYNEAVPYLEKALEYNPNSSSIIAMLSDFYSMYSLNTGKYLEYALKGIQLDVAAMDSATASYSYLRLGNALVQNGFVDESLKYIDLSIQLKPDNPFSRYVRAFVRFAKTRDAAETRNLLLAEFKKDTTRFDILQDIGKVSYYMRDFEGAAHYYQRFIDIRKARQLDVYRHENMIMGYVLNRVGRRQEGAVLISDYKAYIDADRSIYKHLGLSAYYAYQGDQEKSVQEMKLFAAEDNVQYWIFAFIDDDPLFESITKNSAFKKYLDESKAKFWRSHDALKETLDEKGLL